VIGLLVALLLPAIQAAREAARRSSCTNNLRQIGVAVQNYHDTYSALPPGNVTLTAGVCYGSAIPGVGYESEDGANWMISILPFLEQQTLYDTYDFHAYNESPRNDKVRTAPLATYLCPSDLPADELTVPSAGPAAPTALNLPYRPGSYRAMAGRSDGRQFLDSSEFTTYPRSWRGAIHTIGVAGFTVERYRSIVDGTSRTILAGESTTRTNPGYRTYWSYSYGHYSLSSATPQPRTMLADYDQCVSIGGTGSSLPCRRGWGSVHPAGANYLLCDGAVTFYPEDIDVEVFAHLATIDGGEIDTTPDNW